MIRILFPFLAALAIGAALSRRRRPIDEPSLFI